MTLRIAHLSDPHLPAPLGWRDVTGRRLLGRLNWLVNRRYRHTPDRLARIVSILLSAQPDIVLITGDIAQCSLPAEYHRAGESLSPLSVAGIAVLLLKGNHDQYGPGRADRNDAFDVLQKDLAAGLTGGATGLVDLGGADLLLLEQHRVPGLIGAGGAMGPQALSALQADLQNRDAGKPLLAAGHYPLLGRSGQTLPTGCGLQDATALLELLLEHGARLYCCGHVHTPFRQPLAEGLEQHCAGSCTMDSVDQFTIFDVTADRIEAVGMRIAPLNEGRSEERSST